MQYEVKVATSQTGRIVVESPAVLRAQPVSPVAVSHPSACCTGCNAGIDVVGGGDGSEVLVEEDEGVDEIIGSNMEEVQPVKILPAPYTPTEEDVAEHCVDHVQYRSWCEHCVHGFGREEAHVQQADARRIPVVSVEYLLATKDGVYERKEWEIVPDKLGFLNVVVIRGSSSKALFAHAVPRKRRR